MTAPILKQLDRGISVLVTVTDSEDAQEGNPDFLVFPASPPKKSMTVRIDPIPGS